jgi:hypothetical protein
MPPTIRAATPADVPVILSLIHGLAEFERLSREVEATEEKLLGTLFPADGPAAAGRHRGAGGVPGPVRGLTGASGRGEESRIGRLVVASVVGRPNERANGACFVHPVVG